jgi:hypothetical protein
MKKILLTIAALLVIAPVAFANTTFTTFITGLTALTSPSSGDLLYINNGAVDKKITFANLTSSFLNSNAGNWAGTWQTFSPSYFQTALGFTAVPSTRNLTINGTTYDLSADRSWTVAGGGGSAGGTFSTSTYNTMLLQSPYATMITSLDGAATTSSKFWFDPTNSTSYIVKANIPTLTTTAATTTSFAVTGITNSFLTTNANGSVVGTTTPNLTNASVSSVGLSSTNSTLTVGSSPVTTSGTITADLNLGHSNTWTANQIFSNASTTNFTSSGVTTVASITATTTATSSFAGPVTIGAIAASSTLNVVGTTTIGALTGTTAFCIGTDAKIYLYNGSNYTSISFASNSATPVYATTTSPTCQ